MNCLKINQSLYNSQRVLECEMCQSEFIRSSNLVRTECDETVNLSLESLDEKERNDPCMLRNSIDNICLLCKEHYIFSSDFSECVHEPTGIKNCEVYLNESICSICLPNFYLKNNECFSVIDSVTDCVYYQDNGLCMKCKGGFKLSVVEADDGTKSTDCVDDSVLNCDVYDAYTGVCTKCLDGFYLKKKVLETVTPFETTESVPYKKYDYHSDYTTICSPSSIDNCMSFADNISSFYAPELLSDQEKDYLLNFSFPTFIIEDEIFNSAEICNKCNDGFLLSNNACESTSISVQIPKCAKQVSDGVCSACEEGFVLTFEK
jgi:hypothetical protein